MASSETAAAVQRDSEEHATLRRVAVSSFLGNFIEWFDYASYSYFATVIALVLMPPGDPTVALLETFGVFALSFLMRPVGAFFWGHMGDKKGRKWALATSILMMSAATFVIGLLPTFEAVGILAPILLLCLRMVQSFSASGEYAGAATFLAEYAPSNHRGLYCSLVPASTATGLLIGSALATFMFMTWGHDSSFVTEWGWRIPFLLAGPLGLITHYIRTRVSDSPVYQEMQEKLEAKGESDDKPIKLLLTKHLRPLLVSFGACMLNAVGFYACLLYTSLSKNFKDLKRTGTPHRYLEGKNIVLLFQKTSTRTRCAFEVGAMDRGMGVTYLDPGSSQMGKKESIEDTARVLGRFYDGIEFRGFAQSDVEELAEKAGVPVWNGLTDMWHPTQMLADALTVQELSLIHI